MNRNTILQAAAQMLARAGLTVVLVGAATSNARAVELPAQYFRLMEAELPLIERRLAASPAPDSRTLFAQGRMLPGAVMSASVLYSKHHPANPSQGDRQKLELALRLGDLLATESEQGRFEAILNSDWGTYMWLEAYRLLENDLGAERRERWSAALKHDVQQVFNDLEPRTDFPRYQSPFIRTSTNHYSLWASTVHLGGRVFQNKDWESFGAQVMHRLATEEQTPDGYWGELTDNGPTTGYNTLTLSGVALYWEHSHDPASLEAIGRATDFHESFTWPDGTPVETINGRNRNVTVSPWAHFAFSHSPAGRRYAEFLTGFFKEGKLAGGEGGVAQTLGRIAQNALYYHEGESASIPQEQPAYNRRLKVPAGIRKTGPWVVCLSGLIDTPISNQFTLDRQAHLSIYHETLGLVVTGANSKNQPELATFLEQGETHPRHIPVSSRLRMGDDRDRLGLGYETGFVELDLPKPSTAKLPFRFTVIETSPNRLQNARLTLQLCLKAGETLEIAKSKMVLSNSRIELEPEEIGGTIRHHGWRLTVDPSARLIWPVYPFNPYRNGPETDLRHAVGALSIPVSVQPPAEAKLPWRRQELAFELEAN